MKLKNILNKIFNKKKKIESDDSYCYSKIIWNSPDNLIILISFTKDYFEQIIDIQDALNNTSTLNSKIVFSSYDEEVTKEEDGLSITEWIIHKKYYMLIGGSTKRWEKLYMNIHDLGNEALSKISDDITNNCDAIDFKYLVADGVLYNFTDNPKYDTPIISKNKYYAYTDPNVLLSRLPNGFTGRDIIKFIKIKGIDIFTSSSAFYEIRSLKDLNNEEFKQHDLYPLYDALFKNPTMEKLRILFEPLYKQPDDDSIPGDVSDESLDDIFRENYERFSAVSDDSMQYEDIDEELGDDEESENMREGDKIEW